MSFNTNHKQVIIAGGGPSGAATALSLISRGINCLIAEAEPCPKFKAGETIPPLSLPLLQRLKISHLLNDKAHLHCYGNKLIWGDSEPYEKSFLLNTHSHGWHIDRTYFEQQLKLHTIDAGAEWLASYRLTQCKPGNNGWDITLTNTEGQQQYFSCDFIADASGRASRIARSMGIQRNKLDNLTGITMCFHISGGNNPFYTFIESSPHGWWYAAPLSDSRIITTYFTDTDIVDPGMMQTGHHLEAIKNTKMIKGLLDATIINNTAPATYTASTSWLSRRHDKSWLAVGDAAIAYDPISSYGIISALESGYYAGHAIADTLKGSKDALIAYDWLLNKAFATYKEMYIHQYSLEKRWIEEEFWKRRR